MQTYLQNVLDGKLPVNNQVMHLFFSVSPLLIDLEVTPSIAIELFPVHAYWDVFL